jgi:hypothetical protein
MREENKQSSEKTIKLHQQLPKLPEPKTIGQEESENE